MIMGNISVFFYHKTRCKVADTVSNKLEHCFLKDLKENCHDNFAAFSSKLW